jgi:hypothetical protein
MASTSRYRVYLEDGTDLDDYVTPEGQRWQAGDTLHAGGADHSSNGGGSPRLGMRRLRGSSWAHANAPGNASAARFVGSS